MAQPLISLYGFKKAVTSTVIACQVGQSGLTMTAVISKDAGAFGGGSPVSEIGHGFYKCTLTTAQMDADTIIIHFSSVGATVGSYADVLIRTKYGFSAAQFAYSAAMDTSNILANHSASLIPGAKFAYSAAMDTSNVLANHSASLIPGAKFAYSAAMDTSNVLANHSASLIPGAKFAYSAAMDTSNVLANHSASLIPGAQFAYSASLNSSTMIPTLDSVNNKVDNIQQSTEVKLGAD